MEKLSTKSVIFNFLAFGNQFIFSVSTHALKYVFAQKVWPFSTYFPQTFACHYIHVGTCVHTQIHHWYLHRKLTFFLVTAGKFTGCSHSLRWNPAIIYLINYTSVWQSQMSHNAPCTVLSTQFWCCMSIYKHLKQNPCWTQKDLSS